MKDSLITCINETYDAPYNVSNDEIEREYPQAYRAISGSLAHGRFKMWGQYPLFVFNKNGMTRIWTAIPEKEVMGRIIAAKPLGWWSYSNLHRDQKAEMTWMSPIERGAPLPGERGTGPAATGYKGAKTRRVVYRSGSGTSAPEESVYAQYNNPEARFAGSPSRSAHTDIKMADAAKKMEEPKWEELSIAKLRSIIPLAIKKTISDRSYRPVLKRILIAALDNEMHKEVQMIINALPSIKFEVMTLFGSLLYENDNCECSFCGCSLETDAKGKLICSSCGAMKNVNEE